MKKAIYLVSLCMLGTMAHSQKITTIAGTGTAGSSGDGGAATSALLNSPYDIEKDASGNIYICDLLNNKIRKINTSGTISTFAGTGTASFSGDGGAATSATIYRPSGIAIDGSGNVFFADCYNHVIRKINTSGTISTVAGTGGVSGSSGDGGAATSAKLYYPIDVAFDGSGNLYISDYFNHKIRKVNTSGTISTFAGNGTAGFGGDGSAATSANLHLPSGVAADGSGNVYIADYNNNRIRKVNTSGTISTFAGNGSSGDTGDGGAATSATMNKPSSVETDGSNNVYISTFNGCRIRKVNTSGTITTVAGNGTGGSSGDGGVATSANLNNPCGVYIDSGSKLYIADRDNNKIRMVDPYCIADAGVNKSNECAPCCDPSSTQIGTSSISGYSYSWSPTSTLSCSTCAQPNASPCGTTTYTVTVTNGSACLSNTDNVVVTTNTGIGCCRLANFSLTGDQNLGAEFSVNPTFVENTFEVKYKEEAQTLQVLDINGKIVYKIEKLTGTNVSIDISDLSGGVYFVSVLTNGKMETKKIVKK